MEFTITNFNKDLDMYNVVSDSNESRVVTAIQIVSVMAKGFNFTNAFLTRKGFGIKLPGNRNKYVQLSHISKQLDHQIVEALEAKKAKEKELNTPKPVVSTGGRKFKRIVIPTTVKVRINDLDNTPIDFRGKHYNSVRSLCMEYNTNPDSFRSLYNSGRGIEEALGLKLPDYFENNKSSKEVESALNQMAASRGEF